MHHLHMKWIMVISSHLHLWYGGSNRATAYGAETYNCIIYFYYCLEKSNNIYITEEVLHFDHVKYINVFKHSVPKVYAYKMNNAIIICSHECKKRLVVKANYFLVHLYRGSTQQMIIMQMHLRDHIY